MDFGKAFTFAFEDKEWIQKLALASLVLFVSTILIIPAIFFATGYPIVTGRNVLNGAKNPLPTMDNIGGLFKDGLIVFLVGFIYSLPVMIILLPFAIVMGVLSESGDAGEVMAAGAGFIFVCFSFIFAIGLGLFLPAVMAQYVRKSDFAACFRIGEIWEEIARPNLANLVLILLAVIAAQLIAQLVVGVSIITICGPLLLIWPASVWTMAFQGHLYGQLAATAAAPKPEVVEAV